MTLNVNASASRSDLPRSLPWRMALLSIFFLRAVITSSGRSPPPHGTIALLVQQQDQRDQNSYANAHPYLEESLDKPAQTHSRVEEEAAPEINISRTWARRIRTRGGFNGIVVYSIMLCTFWLYNGISISANQSNPILL